jgi:hypothetical protein
MKTKLLALCLVGIGTLACSSITVSIDPTAIATVAAQVLATAAPPTETATVAPGETASPTEVVSGPVDSTSGPSLGGCPMFPPDHIWNVRVDSLPVDDHSDAYIDSLGRDTGLHPDFGSGEWDGAPIGIPYVVAGGDTPRADVTFEYADESDQGPYPIPSDAPIEGGPNSDGDRHILIVESSECKLYELYAAYLHDDGTWEAGSGAIWDLRDYVLRPDEWTSADAAGLPILPGLVRYEEVAAGEIKHALRFTADETQAAYVWPARHEASDNDDPNLPPLGQRFRLKASFDISPYPHDVQVILRAMQVYGLMLADNGSDWFFSGAPDPHWNDEELVDTFRTITGDSFEAVDVSGLMVDGDSGKTK